MRVLTALQVSSDESSRRWDASATRARSYMMGVVEIGGLGVGVNGRI